MQSSKKPASTFSSSLNPELIKDPDLAKRLSAFAPMPEATEAEAITGASVSQSTPQEEQVPLAADLRPMDADAAHKPFKMKQGRYRRTVWFFSFLFFRVIVWEVFISRVMGDNFVARGRSKRWRHYARNFRKLATDMGGVMIKLGRVKGNRMVDMQLSNNKLIDRGTRMVMEGLGIAYEEANALLKKHGSVRAAVESVRTGR